MRVRIFHCMWDLKKYGDLKKELKLGSRDLKKRKEYTGITRTGTGTQRERETERQGQGPKEGSQECISKSLRNFS